jgi:uncharacterized protein YqeY
MAESLRREVDILLSYLPQQLTDDEVEEIVRQTIIDIGENSIKDMGKLMKAVLPKIKGRSDGRVVNTIAKKLLQ